MESQGERKKKQYKRKKQNKKKEANPKRKTLEYVNGNATTGDEDGEEENFKEQKYDDMEYEVWDKFCVYKY